MLIRKKMKKSMAERKMRMSMEKKRRKTTYSRKKIHQIRNQPRNLFMLTTRSLQTC